MHRGDWGALGELQRPEWGCSKVIKRNLKEFLEVYEKRPIGDNEGGMKLNHAVSPTIHLTFQISMHHLTQDLSMS